MTETQVVGQQGQEINLTQGEDIEKIRLILITTRMKDIGTKGKLKVTQVVKGLLQLVHGERGNTVMTIIVIMMIEEVGAAIRYTEENMIDIMMIVVIMIIVTMTADKEVVVITAEVDKELSIGVGVTV